MSFLYNPREVPAVGLVGDGDLAVVMDHGVSTWHPLLELEI